MNTITKRQTKEKELLLEQLKRTPIVQFACEKIGVARATYYRWRKDDQEFAIQTDGALFEGSQLINDMAESQILSAIRDKNMTAIIYWLNHHHPSYATKMEIIAKLKTDNEQLTPEQEALVKNALKLAGLVLTSESTEGGKEK
ncbi:MAG: hypothetical protein KJ915_05705 [Candidatus Omnitrophica bacterium]|nr:hypothetical protein [Candidatus Omnitrophota bacterium]